MNNQKLLKYKTKKIVIVNNNRLFIQKRNISNITNLLSYTPLSKDLKINLNDKSKVLVNFILEHKLTPVYSYEDLHLNETKNKILRETKGLSGIYLVLNKVTLDYYIGSASTGRFFARFSNHLIYFRGSKVVKFAVRKYKLSNFAFLILELFPEIVNKENNKKLIDREDFYLKTLLPNYNILTEAGSSFGYKHTEIDRIKMKTNYSLERRIKIGNLNKGKNLSIETRKKMREKALSRDRTKINLSEKSILNKKQNSKSLILFNLDLTIFGEFKSLTEAAKAINCNVKTIRRALTTEKKILKRRFIVKYINK
uniref:GIY-YIG homing endonuclease n=1 Tax=Fuscoporia gilva TaxID=40471 RepID=UPI0023D7E1D2|nr:GIY-YIG homing endonuclease [Fuscoporia gilva]WDD39646.1 GIY-YIG homing endonuclease [Fuscoporia gilva]